MSDLPLVIPHWPAPLNVRACTTTRKSKDGASSPPFDRFNLALHVGDNPDNVEQNREYLQKSLAIAHKPLWLEQKHTTDLVYFPVVNPKTTPIADACWTDSVGEACVVMTADCMPILLCDQQGTWVAAIHAGWKGLLDGIVQKSLEQILQQKQKNAADVLAWIGPAISQSNFEVGAEVREVFIAAYPFSESDFLPNDDGRYQADLNSIAQKILHEQGVQQVYQSGLCTYAEPEQFYSYRYACHNPREEQKEKGQTGRIATLIWLANESS